MALEFIGGAVVGLALGIPAGIVYWLRKHPASEPNNTAERRLLEAENQQSRYKKQVADHLLRTAELVTSLNLSYQAIEKQLDANTLSPVLATPSDEAASAEPTAVDASTDAPEENTELAPPKDYAPTQGTLNENYGLKGATPPPTSASDAQVLATSALLSQLNQNQQAVGEYLSQSAPELCPGDNHLNIALQQALNPSTPAPETDKTEPESEADIIAPPKDYAPTQGTLNESYGLNSETEAAEPEGSS